MEVMVQILALVGVAAIVVSVVVFALVRWDLAPEDPTSPYYGDDERW